MNHEFSNTFVDEGYNQVKIPLTTGVEMTLGKSSCEMVRAIEVIVNNLGREHPLFIVKGGVPELQRQIWGGKTPLYYCQGDLDLRAPRAFDLYSLLTPLQKAVPQVDVRVAPTINAPGNCFIKITGPNNEKIELSNGRDPKTFTAIVPRQTARIVNKHIWVPKPSPVGIEEGNWYGEDMINLAFDAISILHLATRNLLTDGGQIATTFSRYLHPGIISELVRTDKEKTARYLAGKMLGAVDSYASLSVLFASMLPEWMIEGFSNKILSKLKELGFSGHGFSTINLFLSVDSYPMATKTFPKEVEFLLQHEKDLPEKDKREIFAEIISRIVLVTKDPNEKWPDQKHSLKNPTPQDILSGLLLRAINDTGEKKPTIERNPRKITFDTIHSTIINDRPVLVGTSADGRRYVYWTTIADLSQVIGVYNDPTMGIQRIDASPFKPAWHIETLKELVYLEHFQTTAEMILASLEIAAILSRGPVPGSPRSRRFGLWMPENIWQAIPPERQLPYFDW